MADRDVTIAVKANTADYDSKLLRATAATKKFAAEGRTAGQSLDQIGRTAGRVGLIAAAGLGVMVVAAARFDKSMSAVRAATHETAENMDLLREAAIQAGADTAFSATEAAEGIEELAKAGVATADILGGGLSGALDLAAAGGMAVADAAEATATALQQFKLEGSQASHVADLLAAGAGKAQGSVSDMALALDYAGVPASNLGVSIEETAGAIALFSSNGIIGEKAGTSLRGMLSSLASPSKEAAKVMEDLGIHLFDTQGKFIGLAGTADQLQSKMAGLTDEERNNALGRLFSNAQLSAANILYREGGDAVESWTASVNDQGYAAETAALKMDNLAGDIEKFKGSLETALITAGEGGQGPLRKLVQGATGAVNAFTNMPGPIRDTATAMLGITAITGGGLWFGSKVIRSVADTSEALKKLEISAGKTRIAAASVGKGIEVAALLTSISLINDAFHNLYDNVNDLDLNRNLEALARGETVKNLEGIGKHLATIDSTSANVFDHLSDVFTLGIDENALENSLSNVDKIDQTLAQMVESGNAEMAADAMREIILQAAASGVSIDDVTKAFDDYQVALRNAAAATALQDEGTRDALRSLPVLGGVLDDVAGSQDKVTSSTKRVYQGHKLTEEQVKSLTAAYHDEVDAARGVAQQFVNLGDSLDDTKVSLKGWLRDLEEQARALRNFRLNAQEAADKGLRQGLIDALEEAGPAGALRMKQLANATESEIARANHAWQLGRGEIKRYIDATTEFPTELKTKLTVEEQQALTDLKKVSVALAGLNDKTIYVTTILRTLHQESRAGDQGAGGSGGGHGTGGGYTPRMLSGGGTSFPTTTLPTIDLTNVDIRGLRQALFDFAVAASDGANGVRSAVEDLRSSLLEAGGVWTGNLELQSQKLIATAEAYDDAKASLADLTSQQRELVAAVRSAFTHDLFGNGLQGFFLQAEADTNDAATFQKVLQELKAMGLDGPAFERLAASGDLATAQELLASGLIDEFEKAIVGREAQLSSLGAVVGQELGMAIREQTATLYTLDRSLESQEAALVKLTAAVEGVKADIKDGAYTGTYRGAKDALDGRDARTAAGRR